MDPQTRLQIWVTFQVIFLILITAGFFYVIRLLVKALRKYLKENNQKDIKS
jgi:uncharacterized membrane protein